ncbi:cytochrome c oxidase subunit II [soil metagenome]
MNEGFQFMPDQASSVAPQVDHLYYFLIAVTVFFTVLIFVLIVYLGLKYRRKSEAMPPHVHGNMKLEIAWTIVPMILVIVMFVWGASLFVQMSRPPANAMDIYIVGKQWMWFAQHPSGPRENNELHVPVGKPIKLTMASQDVIHSFFIPAFRVKQDVIPGRYSYEWFTPTAVGEYHLFCAEYCGKGHSQMIGKIVVMDEAKYQAWLSGSTGDEPMARAGERLFSKYSCATCHGQQGPTMAGLYGAQRTLTDGSKVVADDAYLRESILNAPAKLVAGYPPIMPSYRGQLTEEQIAQLIVYIKSLKVPQRNY